MASEDDTNNSISVAIIGGGIAGLSCARHLQLQSNGKLRPTVFDTGRLRPGGRCSSRLPNDPQPQRNTSKDTILSSVIIDHTAQILTLAPTDNNDDNHHYWSQQIQEWKSQGILRNFPPNSVVQIRTDRRNKEDDGAYFIQPCKTSNMYYGTNGMASIPLALTQSKDDAELFPIYQDVWISPSNGVKYKKDDNKWSVQTNGRSFGSFDALVIAHNGKCADRLMSKTPAKALHSLLVTNFSPNVPAWGGNRMTLNSIYSLTFAIPRNSPTFDQLHQALNNMTNNNNTKQKKKSDYDSNKKDGIICAFIQNHPNLRMLTNQSEKYKSNSQKNDKYVVYTLLSSATFGKKFKGPQENLPPETVEKVSRLLYKSLEESLRLSEGAIGPSVADSRLQLWGAAVPINTYDSPDGFAYDSKYKVGACGDWLLDSSIQGAWESGRRLANHMIQNHQKDESVGLPEFNPETKKFKSKFRVNKHSGIGNIR